MTFQASAGIDPAVGMESLQFFREHDATTKNVCVIGAGYVGLVTSACLAALGHHVRIVESNAARLEALRQGRTPIYEPGLDELVALQHDLSRLDYTGDYASALRDADFAMITVNTPPGERGEADISNVLACATSILQHAPPGLVMAIKSTVPVGTADRLQDLVDRAAVDVAVVSNPEFLRQGSAISDFMNPDRIVVGSSQDIAGLSTASLYRSIDAPVLLCDRRSAELAKYVSNALLATRVSFINEIAAICEAAEANVEDVSTIVGLDHRLGASYLKPGLGWGGSCLPKDVRALTATAAAYGCSTPLLDATSEVNRRQTDRALEKLILHAGLNRGSVVGILGLSFKPNTDDIRGAPSLRLIEGLLGAGMQIRAHDPAAIRHVGALYPQASYCDDIYETARGCDALVLCTEWQDYCVADWARVRSVMREAVVLDGRNTLDQHALSSLGFKYLGVGRLANHHPSGRNGADRRVAYDGAAVRDPSPKPGRILREDLGHAAP